MKNAVRCRRRQITESPAPEALRTRGKKLIAQGERQSGAALLDLADTLDRARELGRAAKRGQIAFQRGRQ